MQEMALSSQAACHSFLTVRLVPIVSARRFTAGRSTITEFTHARSEAAVRGEG